MLHFILCAVLLGVSFRFIKYLYLKFTTNKSTEIFSYGKWAVITGATDGIGKSFAEHFAENGLNIVLISRSQDKLETVAKNIETTFGVSTKVIQADFAILDDATYNRINNELKDLDIGILVNNVGISYAHPEYFINLKDNHNDLYSSIINCNISSTVNMCRFVLPGMAARGKGCIINLSSGLADIPAPLLTVYAASKSFISKFSQDLGIEYKSKGIKVQWLKPGLVATNMSQISKTSWLVPTPKMYVTSALNELSITDSSEGYFSHILTQKVTIFLAKLFPNFMDNKLLSIMLDTRKRALKKCTKCNTST